MEPNYKPGPLENDRRRRITLDRMHPVERKLYDLIQEVEKMGADENLTASIIFLGKAKDSLSDFIDARGPVIISDSCSGPFPYSVKAGVISEDSAIKLAARLEREKILKESRGE